MKHNTTITTDSNMLAITHHADETWRCLAVTMRNDVPEIVDASTFRDQDGLNVWLSKHSVSRVINVLPASSIICRTCLLPDVAPDQLEMALQLQAEAHLAGLAAAHRQSMNVLHPAEGETSRIGLIVAWPETGAFECPSTELPVTHAPDIAALAALINGDRPTEPLVWLDRRTGSIALALSHANGVSFRATTDDISERDEAQESVGQILAETAMNAQHTTGFVKSVVESVRSAIATSQDRTLLLLPHELIDRAVTKIDGARSDTAWWSTYGIAAGVLLATTDELASMTELVEEMPQESPSILDSTVQTLSRPRTGALLLLVAVLLLIFGPLVANGARVVLLRWKYPELAGQMAALDTLEKKYEIYKQLEETGWSVSKVLGDLANCTPMSAKIETIRLTGTGVDRTISVQGYALPEGQLSGQAIISQMSERMSASRVFTTVDPEWGDPDFMGKYEFTVTAKVTAPYRDGQYEPADDFAVWTATDRKYGTSLDEALARLKPAKSESESTMVANAGADVPMEIDGNSEGGAIPELQGGSPSSSSSSSSSRPGGGGRPSRPQLRGTGGGGGHGEVKNQSDQGERPVTGGGAVQVPPALTEQQIQTMSEAEVKNALRLIAEAQKRRSDLDEETLTRFRAESKMLFDQLRAQKAPPTEVEGETGEAPAAAVSEGGEA